MAYSFSGNLGMSLYNSENKVLLPNGKVTRNCQLTPFHESLRLRVQNLVTFENVENAEQCILTSEKAFDGLFVGFDTRIGPVISVIKTGKKEKVMMPICYATFPNSLKVDVLLFDCDGDGRVECEKQRVAKLEYMMHIVQIGEAIQHGDK